LASRLFFQLTAAAVAAVILLIIWRRTRSPAALIWLGLQPVFGAVAVNGGHNDLVVGLAILAAALAASRRNAVWAGVAVGIAALIKITALLALVGLVFWLWHRSRVRAAVVAIAATAATLLVGYLAVIGDAAHVLAGADHTVTPGSPWNGIADLVLGSDAGRAFAHPLAPNDTLEALFVVGAVTIVGVALLAGWFVARGARNAPDARRPVGTTAATYTMAAEYSFPWYATWALPCFADGAPDALAWIVWAQGAVMLASLKLTVHPNGTVGDAMFRWPITYLAPPLFLVALVVAALRTGRTTAPDPSDDQRVPG
jgi:alpha-1,6-mannosyltransferase